MDSFSGNARHGSGVAAWRTRCRARPKRGRANGKAPPGGLGCVANKGLAEGDFGSVAMIGVSRRFFGCVARKGDRRKTSCSCISGRGSPRDFTGVQNADRNAPTRSPRCSGRADGFWRLQKDRAVRGHGWQGTEEQCQIPANIITCQYISSSDYL